MGELELIDQGNGLFGQLSAADGQGTVRQRIQRNDKGQQVLNLADHPYWKGKLWFTLNADAKNIGAWLQNGAQAAQSVVMKKI